MDMALRRLLAPIFRPSLSLDLGMGRPAWRARRKPALPSGLIASAVNLLLFEVFSVRSLLAHARARRSATENRPRFGAAPIFIFSGCGAGAAGVRRFERSELGGLRRQQRIATTWTWVFSVRSLLRAREAERDEIGRALGGADFRYFSAVAVPARPGGGSSGAS